MVDKEREPRKHVVARITCCASGDPLVAAIQNALVDREHVVMVRVNAQVLQQLDMLVDASICRSRSSAATFMIREGIKANATLFDKVAGATTQIAELRASLRDAVGEIDEDSA
jgi:hypothetical protein